MTDKVSLESSEFRFLFLPRENTRERTGPLIVGLHQGERLQHFLPLREVVDVLEGGMVGVVEEVEDHHDGEVSEGGRGSSKPFSSTLLQQILKRLQPLWQEFAKIFFHLKTIFFKFQVMRADGADTDRI